jgi:hypothetical protein
VLVGAVADPDLGPVLGVGLGGRQAVLGAPDLSNARDDGPTMPSLPSSLVCTNQTGSLVDVADNCCSCACAGVNLANGGAEWPVGGAGVLNRRGTAGVASAGVAPRSSGVCPTAAARLSPPWCEPRSQGSRC